MCLLPPRAALQEAGGSPARSPGRSGRARARELGVSAGLAAWGNGAAQQERRRRGRFAPQKRATCWESKVKRTRVQCNGTPGGDSAEHKPRLARFTQTCC